MSPDSHILREFHYIETVCTEIYVMPIYDVPNRVQRVFIINVESNDQNMSNMASCIGIFYILCVKNTDMLLFTTNIDIAYECSLYAGTWCIRSVYVLLHTLHMGTAISTGCMVQSGV